jgi:hypothetical protein
MKTGLYIAAVFTAFALYSCEKDDDTPAAGATPATNNNNTNLTSHYWRAASISGRIVGDTDMNSTMDTMYYSITPDSCLADDRFYFHTNGYYVSDPGIVMCSSTLDSTTWSLVNNNTQIVLDTTTYTILNLTSNQLKVTSTITLTAPLFIFTDTTTLVYP